MKEARPLFLLLLMNEVKQQEDLMSKIFNNTTDRVVDDLKATLKRGDKVAVASALLHRVLRCRFTGRGVGQGGRDGWID